MKFLPVAKVLGQLVITGPVIVFFPFAVFIFLPMLPFTLFSGEPDTMVKSLAYGLGGAGLLGLYTAILVPHRLLRKFAALRWGVVAGIGCGLVSTGILLFMPEDSGRLAGNLDAYQVWLFGGPLLTGGWNIFQLSAGRASPPAQPASAG